jgi:hypothetical protein
VLGLGGGLGFGDGGGAPHEKNGSHTGRKTGKKTQNCVCMGGMPHHGSGGGSNKYNLFAEVAGPGLVGTPPAIPKCSSSEFGQHAMHATARILVGAN